MTRAWQIDRASAVAPSFSITLQLEPGDMAPIRASGFRTVINTRPDFEGGPGQPSSAALEAAAMAEGLTYPPLPAPPSDLADADARRMADLGDASPKPVLAFCRTGRRAAHLYLKGKALS